MTELSAPGQKLVPTTDASSTSVFSSGVSVSRRAAMIARSGSRLGGFPVAAH
jgi:hypothetical protein